MAKAYDMSKDFDAIDKLAPAFRSTITSILTFSSGFVQPREGVRVFDWSGFKNAVISIPGDSIIFDNFSTNTISRTDGAVDIMIDQGVDVLMNTLTGSPIDAAEIRQAIAPAYDQLTVAEDYNNPETDKATWEYRIVFFLPKAVPGDYLAAFVTTVKLERHVEREQSRWSIPGLGSKVETLSATISVMNLSVKQGFEATA